MGWICGPVDVLSDVSSRLVVPPAAAINETQIVPVESRRTILSQFYR